MDSNPVLSALPRGSLVRAYDHPGSPMDGWPLERRVDAFAAGLLEAFCPHGIGHPIPESIAWLDRHGPFGSRNTWGFHGCDGCCAGAKNEHPGYYQGYDNQEFNGGSNEPPGPCRPTRVY